MIEDDELTRTTMRMILEDLGYRVLSAETGKHASQLNRSFDGRIDLLLSDIMIPDGNGVDWAKELKLRRPSMGTVFMSGYTREDLQKEGIPDPGGRLLKKPFAAGTLARALRDELDP
jgi:DNA-binding response OmpR family regulator